MIEDNEIKMPENAPDDMVLINDEIMTLGAFSISVRKIQDEDGEVSVVFEGVLETPYYEQEITKIESRRYIVDGIDVYEENFGSAEEKIIYKFTCSYFRTKYQTNMHDSLENVLNYGKEEEA